MTQVLEVKNVSAAQLVPMLRPLMPQNGQLAAYPPGQHPHHLRPRQQREPDDAHHPRIDQVGNQDVEIVPLQNASASEIVRVVNSLYQGAAASEGVAVKVVADERSNSVLIGGEPAQRLRLRALVAHLDTPLEAGGDTQVRYLHYADAEKLAPKLKEQITGIAQAARRCRRHGRPGAAGSPLAQAEKSAMIWADPTNNALVITAPPEDHARGHGHHRQARHPPPAGAGGGHHRRGGSGQDRRAGRELGGLLQGHQRPRRLRFVTPVGGTSIVDLADAIQNPTNASTTLLQGHDRRHRPRRRHRRQLRRDAARDPQRYRHQRHRHALGA